jgi:hypothetical protein
MDWNPKGRIGPKSRKDLERGQESVGDSSWKLHAPKRSRMNYRINVLVVPLFM